jgi:hypothetical protein
MSKEPGIHRWRLHRGQLDTYVLGIPAYKHVGTDYVTGTNKEANAEARRRTDAEPEPGIKWSVIERVEDGE